MRADQVRIDPAKRFDDMVNHRIPVLVVDGWNFVDLDATISALFNAGHEEAARFLLRAEEGSS